MKLDEPTLRAGSAADEKRLRDLGYDASWLLIDRGETAEAALAAALKEKTSINVVHVGAPHAKICFNTVPEDTAVSVQRWV